MRKLSNVICLLGAIIGSLFGIYYVFNPTIYISNLLLINIITMLITDTITGFLNYFKEMGILTGWVHHIGYTLFLLKIYRDNNTKMFAYGCLEEIPSMILFGKRYFGIHNRYIDLLFGVTFFLFRIVYHIYMIYLCSTINKFYLGLSILVFIIHSHWFYDWYQKYTKKKLN